MTTPPDATTAPPQKLWPIATVMATGIFATTFVQTQTLAYLPFNHLLTVNLKLDSNQAATFFSLCILPWSFKVIAGLFVDGLPLFGSRRRAYLVLSAITAAAIWLVMGLAPAKYNLLLVLAVAMNTAIVFGSTTSGGLLVEAGQRFNASGRLSSLRVFAQNFGAALGTLLGGLLAAYALTWTSAVAMLPLLCMFFAAWLLLREPPLPPSVAHGRSFFGQLKHVVLSIWSQIKNVLRWQMLLPALLLCFIQAVPTFRSTCFYQYQTTTLHYSDAALGWLGLAGYGAALLSSGVYAWWCRKVPLRVSLYAVIILTYLSALPYLFYTSAMPRALAIESLGTFLQYLAYLPLFDLAVRCTPKGSEALGYSLLISVWNIGLAIGTKTGPMLYEHSLGKGMNSLIWLNAGVTLAGIAIVFLMPRTLLNAREGK
jgi:predicted MFS family arabinose efflux permease